MRWSLLSGVYARGSERSHTGGKCIICSGLANSREDNSCVSPSLGCLEETTTDLRPTTGHNDDDYEDIYIYIYIYMHACMHAYIHT